MDSYEYTDKSGDSLTACVMSRLDGPSLYVETDPDGVVIPLEGIDAYVQAMQELAETARRRANRLAREAELYRPANGPQTPAQAPTTPKE